jgi:ribonuclease P protein component
MLTERSMTLNSFPASHRLLRSEEFDAVFQNRDFSVSSRSFLLLARKNALDSNRLGMVIAKKNLPRAVDRNRVKRCIREVFRGPAVVNNLDLVVLARKGALTESKLHEHFARLWAELQAKATS